MELSRSSRVSAPPYDDGDVVVEAPPDVPKAAPTNLLARLLPVAMVVAMGGMAVLYFSSGAASSRNPMFLFFPVMMLVSVLGSVAYGARGTRRSGELDEDRRAYLRYLDVLDRSLRRTAEAQHLSLHWSHPDPGAAWTLVGGARMWERRQGDADFCRIRVGIGTLMLAETLIVPEQGQIESRDPVTAQALARVIAERSRVSGLPVTIDLLANRRIAIEGAVGPARALARAMLCQLAVLHGPDDVGIVDVALARSVHWDWLKWLPHHRRSVRVDAQQVLVAVVEGADRDDPDVVRRLGQLANDVIVVEIGQAPSEDYLRIDVDTTIAFETPDELTPTQAVVCARSLAPFRPATTSFAGPVGWQTMIGIGDPAHVDEASPWPRREARQVLRVPIGTCDRGEVMELDLKEAAAGGMGPHGLCIGATGSGKSEFLRTLVLGLVATHGPEALNLALVDFKGGATFLGLERLNHVSAVVTNLSEEAHLVSRMRDALAGEMTRRQELLRAAGGFASIGDYDRARAAGVGLAPLPALLIVVDEFSELLSQHPDFADLFVAMGRLGRSLGMHLLLASQRLDEGRLRGLETHLSYRICLKTFSASESRAVLGTTDAYELPATPGAAILKTASGDLVRFRTAFVSGPVIEADPLGEPAPALFTSVADGPPVGEVARAGSTALLDVVVGSLAGRGEPAHRVWLPPLTTGTALGSLLTGESDRSLPLVVPIGLVDNPFAQRRDVLAADLRGAFGNVAVVGGPRTGKTTTLHTLLLALAATRDPRDVQIHGLDFGGGALASVNALPHVGTVAGRFERDLARRVVAHVQGVVRDREIQRRQAAADHRPADVFLVVDGWAVARQEFDGMEEAVTAIAAQGLSVGVHVVIAASRWADIRPALKDQLGTRIELRLGDPADSEMDRKRARLLGERPPGHGITRDGLEFAIAVPRLDGDVSSSATAALEAAAEFLALRYEGRSTPAVRLLPSLVPYASAGTPEFVALGIGEDELRPLAMDFQAHPHLLILGETECGKTGTLRILCREIMRTHGGDQARILVVDFRRTLLGIVESDHLHGYAASAAAAQSQVSDAASMLVGRLPDGQVTQRELRDRSWWSGPDVYVIVDDYDLVCGASGNPLAPLLDLLPHARDVGLHVVIARRSGGAARAMFDPLLARLRDLGCAGLLMSASPDEGLLLGSVRPSSLPAGRGSLIRRGLPEQLVQVSWSDPP